jgi:hypothetical protein
MITVSTAPGLRADIVNQAVKVSVQQVTKRHERPHALER